MRRLALLCLLAASPLRAEPAAAWAEVHDALAAEAAAETLLPLAEGLAGGVLLPPVPKAEAKPAGAVEVRAGQIQAALTQLSILSGGNGHLALQLAQASRTDVVDLIQGRATLADLGAVDGLIARRANGWRLSRPLVVWPNAALVLSPGEVLDLDTAAGAFILSFGDIQITGATVRGDGGQNARVPGFRPFLLVTGQGSFRAERSTFADLGFHGPVAFRGVSILTGGLLRPATPTVVTDSRFVQVFSLSAEGADGLMLLRNRLSGAGAAAVSVKGGSGMVIGGNRIAATGEGAGIRLSGALLGVRLLGNLIEGGGRNGLQIDGASRGLVLRGNVVAGNAEAGIAIHNAACLAVEGNILVRNGSAGLRLTRTGQARIAGNAIMGNGAAGIDVAGQGGLGTVLLSGNQLARNREGLRAAGLGEVRLKANDLADQTPRQFAGDFAPWLGAYLTAGTDLVIPAALVATATAPKPCLVE